MRIANNSIYLYRAGLYPKKLNKTLQSIGKNHNKTPKNEVIFPSFPGIIRDGD